MSRLTLSPIPFHAVRTHAALDAELLKWRCKAEVVALCERTARGRKRAQHQETASQSRSARAPSSPLGAAESSLLFLRAAPHALDVTDTAAVPGVSGRPLGGTTSLLRGVYDALGTGGVPATGGTVGSAVGSARAASVSAVLSGRTLAAGGASAPLLASFTEGRVLPRGVSGFAGGYAGGGRLKLGRPSKHLREMLNNPS